MPFALIVDLLCLEARFIIHLLRFAKSKIQQLCRRAEIELLNVYSSCTVATNLIREWIVLRNNICCDRFTPCQDEREVAGRPVELQASRVHTADCCEPVV